MKNIVIVGQNGNLAKALANQFPNAIQVEREEYLLWLTNPTRLQDYFKNQNISGSETIVFNCAGVINPNAALNEINLLNFDLPVFLSEESTNLNFRLFTFGTVMEKLPKYASSNSYLDSKLRFYNKFIGTERWVKSNTHVQMHTLYGGIKCHPHMFLGQMHQAISRREIFKMTGGEQIREYHHLDDDARAVKLISTINTSGVMDISHGKPEKLKDIANAIFSHFDLLQFLKLSENQTDVNDNLGVIFKRSEVISSIAFRDPIDNIIKWLEEQKGDNE